MKRDRVHIPTGWWFGCHVLNFPINIGLLSSSQLTNSIIFQRGGPGPPTSPVWDAIHDAGKTRIQVDGERKLPQ